MSDTTIRITDNSDLVGEEFEQACERALTRIGFQAETFAKEKCPVDTGNLRNSISNKVQMSGENSVYIGTNVAYAQYVELGVRGRTGRPFIKPAASEHSDVYRRILEDELKG